MPNNIHGHSQIFLLSRPIDCDRERENEHNGQTNDNGALLWLSPAPECLVTGVRLSGVN